MAFNLSFINAKTVLGVGLLGAAVTSHSLGLLPMIAVTALSLGVALLTYSGKIQSIVSGFFAKKLAGFADVPAWPRFVLLGLATLVAGHHGGIHADITLGFLLAAMDGNVFDALY